MDAIPARLRKTLYLVLFIAGVVVGALQVADVDTGKAVDVIAYLGTALGLVAAGNVQPKNREEGGASVVGVLLGVALVLLILWLVGVNVRVG